MSSKKDRTVNKRKEQIVVYLSANGSFLLIYRHDCEMSNSTDAHNEVSMLTLQPDSYIEYNEKNCHNFSCGKRSLFSRVQNSIQCRKTSWNWTFPIRTITSCSQFHSVLRKNNPSIVVAYRTFHVWQLMFMNKESICNSE